MTTIFCTLYNSLYLDKGLVLYDSLCECAKDFKLYVLCMDEMCYEVLKDLRQEHLIPVKLSDFEEGDDALLEAKTNRSIGEYCWTCSSSFIRYVLKHFGEEMCTYIDADMYFYNDPKLLIEEMIENKKSVMVVPHRFTKEKEGQATVVGLYCVEFNTFLNNAESMEVLNYWRGRCLECCSNLRDGVHWGDQKYLEELVEKFPCVHVCNNPGAGIAYWNLPMYKLTNDCEIYYGNKIITPFFYHFQGISNINKKLFVVGGLDKRTIVDHKLVGYFYNYYLMKIHSMRFKLEARYEWNSLVVGHPSEKHFFTDFKRTKIGGYLNFLFLSLFMKAWIIKIR